MADTVAEPRRTFKGCCWSLIDWVKSHFLAVNFCVMGVVGAFSGAFLIEDAEWKLTCFMYLSALTACSVVCLICKRGHLYYKSVDEARDRFKASRRPVLQVPHFKKPKDSENTPLISEPPSRYTEEMSEGEDSDYFKLRTERQRPGFGSFRDIKGLGTETGVEPNEKVVEADVHQSDVKQASTAATPNRATPENEEESTSSVAVPSDPQNSSSTPDSGVTVQTSAQSPQTSGEEHQRPPTPNQDNTSTDVTNVLE